MFGKTIPWGRVEFVDSIFALQLSESLSIEMRKDKDEIFLTTNAGGEISCSRWITGAEHEVFLEPGLPDLPIILKPSQNISILPSRKLEVFVEVPFVIKIFYGTSHKKTLLTEVNAVYLSKSFFGNSENGEFAYYLESPLYRDISDYDAKESSVYCPLVISNKSSQNLEFEKMIFRAPYLSIYKQRKLLTASSVHITFRGQEQISQIIYKKTPPSAGGEAKLLSPPRMEEDKNLLKRSFYFIKNLYTG